MTEQTLLNHFNVWSDEHLIKEVVPEDIQKMLSCPESKTLHTKYDWEMPEWVRMDPQQKEAWYKLPQGSHPPACERHPQRQDQDQE